MDNDYDGDGVPDDEDDDDDNDGIPDDLKYDDFISGEDEGNYGTRDSEDIDQNTYILAFLMNRYHDFSLIKDILFLERMKFVRVLMEDWKSFHFFAKEW